MPRREVPIERVRVLNRRPIRPDGAHVVYWMTANRRASWNFALDHAVDLALELGRPLVVLEALRCDYRWASDRHHAFVLQGMRDNAQAFERAGVAYHPYVESEVGAGKGLLEALARDACAVVTDDYPCFFLPRMQAAAAEKLEVRLEAVDSNGLLPLRAAPRVFLRAFDLRRFLQRSLAPHLEQRPRERPFSRVKLPRAAGLEEVFRRWPRASEEALSGEAGFLAELPIDHAVAPAPIVGGSVAGAKSLRVFTEERLGRYDSDRNQPDSPVTSELSAYLHFGHVSSHQVFARIVDREDWNPDDLSASTSGAREGWWGMSSAAEAYLDQLVTWRELGFNMCAQRDDHDRFESLPDWAQQTLAEHEGDERPHLYDLDQFEEARTHDEIWNAAQNELRATGRMHNYLRMLWGKKILHWSETPRQALEVMIGLNNKYALDGRDPNSYSGIFWVLGRYDRPWGPEREVFGKVRFMSSRNTRRKLRIDDYVQRWTPGLFGTTNEAATACSSPQAG